MKCEVRMTARDVDRPEWQTKDDIARWISDEFGIPLEQVRQQKRASAAAAGMEWRADDHIGYRRRAMHRLNTTKIGATPSTTVEPAATQRAELPAAPSTGVSARVRRLIGGLS